jgi:hypothetical protein
MSYYVIHNNAIIYSSILFIDSWLFATLYKSSTLIVGGDGEWAIKGLKEEKGDYLSYLIIYLE